MTGSRVLSVSLPGGPGALARARAVIDTVPASLERQQRCDLRLALTELVANSVVHGRAGPDEQIDVQFTVDPEVIRCEVADEGPGFSAPFGRQSGRPPEVRGLLIVDRIASRWGTRRRGRAVWFELDRASSAIPRPLEPVS